MKQSSDLFGADVKRGLAFPIEDYKWLVQCYYNDTVKPPKVPGELATEVACLDDNTKDFEVSVAESRDDVTVIVIQNPKWRGW